MPPKEWAALKRVAWADLAAFLAQAFNDDTAEIITFLRRKDLTSLSDELASALLNYRTKIGPPNHTISQERQRLKKTLENLNQAVRS